LTRRTGAQRTPTSWTASIATDPIGRRCASYTNLARDATRSVSKGRTAMACGTRREPRLPSGSSPRGERGGPGPSYAVGVAAILRVYAPTQARKLNAKPTIADASSVRFRTASAELVERNEELQRPTPGSATELTDALTGLNNRRFLDEPDPPGRGCRDRYYWRLEAGRRDDRSPARLRACDDRP
jgi:hypothetical protein